MIANIVASLKSAAVSYLATRRVIQALKARSVQDFSLTAASNFIISVSSAIGGILAARLLGPVGRGEFASATVWAAILGVIATLGLPQALTYFTASRPALIGDIFATAMVILAVQSVGILIVGWLAVDLIAPYQPTAVEAIKLYLFSIPCTQLITYLNTMAQGLRRFKLFNILRIVLASGYVFSLLLADVLGQHQTKQIIALMLGLYIVIAIGGLFFFLLKVKPQGHFNFWQARQLLGYGLRSYWGSLSWMANGRLDQFIMSVFMNLGALGQYAVAVSYASVLFPLSGAFAMVLYPRVVEGHRNDAPRRIVKALKLNLLLTGGGAILLGLLTPFLVPLLFGPSFELSIYPANILLLGTVFLGCNYVLSDGLRGMGHPLVTSIGETAGAITTVLGLFLLLPTLGIVGAAWASVFSYSVVLLILLLWYRRQALILSNKDTEPAE